MLCALNVENAHDFGDTMPQLFRLRYNEFHERQRYRGYTFKDMEYDQFDTPATIHLAWMDENKRVQGGSRLNPIDRPYMLKEVFRDLVTGEIPSSPHVWEGSRICINKTLEPATRNRIKRELVLGYLEFGVANRIEQYVGVMHNFVWNTVLTQSGWDHTRLGPDEKDNKHTCHARQVCVSPENLRKVRLTTDIDHDILENMINFYS